LVDAPTVWIDGKSVPARANLGIFTQPLSIVGMPILSVPWMRLPSSDLSTQKELPIGIQIATWPGREDLLFAFAKRLESCGLIGSRCPIQHIS
jgi:aspartyl-tRNA(Asn)/glutamyl-tRNA(Gln) amidotransferase subunit A